MENRLIIEIDVRECIEAFKNQINVSVRERGRIGLKRSLILPVSQADPLQMEFIIFIEWIRDEVAVQQVSLNYSRNLRGMPFFDVASIRICNGSKLPFRIKVPRGGFSGLERQTRERTNEQEPENEKSDCRSDKTVMMLRGFHKLRSDLKLRVTRMLQFLLARRLRLVRRVLQVAAKDRCVQHYHPIHDLDRRRATNKSFPPSLSQSSNPTLIRNCRWRNSPGQ